MQAPMQTAPQLEQAQKAQQILSMLTHQQSQPAQLNSSPYQPHMAATSPPVPSQPHLLQQPFVQPVPPTEDQASQVQQLLGLLSQAAAQQQQHQQIAQPPVVSPSVIPQAATAAPIPGMDPATALSQLAVLLQQQQQQQP
ncbi:hypothetical protein ABG067_008884, partial [Albugo candida]